MEVLKKIILQNLPFLIIGVLGILLYAGTLNYSFHFDDLDFIILNPSIRHLDQLPSIWKSWRIVTFFTFYLNYQIHRLDVVGYHVVNILIHIANAFLVRWLILLILSTKTLKEEAIVRHKATVALCAALLFVSHPIQTQAVTYITQRFTSLAVFFYLLSVCLYFRGRLLLVHPQAPVYFFGAALSGGLAIFSKETALTLPLTLVLCEFYFLSTSSPEEKRQRQIHRVCLIFLFLLSLSVALMFAVQFKDSFTGPQRSGSHDQEFVTSGLYFLTQWRVMIVYLRLLFLPFNQNLDYDFSLSCSILEWPTLLSGLALLGLGALAFRWRQRYRLISFSVFWFFVTLLVESSLIPISEVMDEHRIYLPSVGFVLGVCVTFYALLNDRWRLTIAIGALVCVYSFLTVQRNKVWHDEISLWSDVIARSPHKSRGYLNRGMKYGRLGMQQKALDDYKRVLEINPQQKDVYSNMGCVYLRLGKMDEALQDFNNGLGINPRDAVIYHNRGQLYQQQGRRDLALADFSKSLALDPHNAMVYCSRGELYQNNHQDELALADYNQSLKIDRDNALAYSDRGSLHFSRGEYEPALADYDKVLHLNPHDLDSYHRRGLVHIALKNYDLALNDFNRAIERNPNSSDFYHDRGSLFGLTGHMDLAIADYDRALALNPKDKDVYYNRALVYEAMGQFKKASADARQAQALGYANLDDFIKEMEKRSSSPP